MSRTIEIGEEYDLLKNGEKIGRFRYVENHLESIEVNPDNRGEGYGTEALKVWIESCKEEGYSEVTTTPATSQEMKYILKKLGFERIKNPSEYNFRREIDNPNWYRSCWVKPL
ncbi:GNAT family N-acetyltransferase [Halorarius halobius]|uniref:GNAT family N-acetyltransferase n=1 Tax=Halorarius halobius TaxID=2962671 RepID=UPI0020CBB9BC|nr:GNAT family N-acetyltransferase [Halorarius halobius]